MTSSGQNRSNYSAAAVNSGPQRTGRRKAADAKPLSSEAMLGRPLADQSKTETVPATASGETQRFESPSPSPMAPKRIPPDQRQTASSTMTISTETVRRKADETPPFTSETISGRPSPDPNKTETVPATASCERERIGSHFSSQKILKQAPPDRRQTPPAMKAKAETVRRKAVDNQPLVPGSIPDLPRQESGDAKGQPGPERAKTAFVAAKSKIAPHDLRPPGTAVGFDAARRVHQKVADLQPYVSEPIQRRPWSDLDRTRRGPSPDNATYFELTTEGNPSSREMQMPSGPGRDRSPRVGIDGERRTESGRVAAERELLIAPGPRAPPVATGSGAPTDSIKIRPTKTNTTIQVKIGRVEVRACAPTSPPSRGAPPPAPKLSLDDYLKQRDGGRL